MTDAMVEMLASIRDYGRPTCTHPSGSRGVLSKLAEQGLVEHSSDRWKLTDAGVAALTEAMS